MEKFKDIELPIGTLPTLETMFVAKSTLLVAYYNAGKLPFNFKEVNLNERETQNWIRESMGCLHEEIFEAKEVLDIAHNEIERDYLLASTRYSEEVTLELREEIADVLHFWIELFIFSGLTYQDITLYYFNLYQERGLHRYNNCDEGFRLAMMYANKINSNNFRANYGGITLLSTREFIVRNGNPSLLSSIKHLNIARNKLKNKYWKTTNTDTNTEEYLSNLMEAFINYTLYLDVLNFSTEELITDYLKKNLINQQRIEKGW